MTSNRSLDASTLPPSSQTKAAKARQRAQQNGNCLPGITLEGTGANDTFTGTADSDTLRGRGGQDALTGLACNDRLFGNGENDQLVGDAGNDQLNGNNGDDRLNGGSGKDTLNGDDGKDRLEGRGGNDQLNGGKKSDRLFGDAGNDRLNGGKGGDTLRAGDGNDRLSGGNGNDILVGGFGEDRITSGTGKDRFIYNSISEGSDRIIDFDTDDDKIDLSAIFNDDKYNSSDRFRDYVVVVNDSSDVLIRVDPDGEDGDLLFRTVVRLVDTNFDKVDRGNFIL